MLAAARYDMGYYSPQEQRTAQLNARIPKSVQEGLKDLARLWTHIERVRTNDPEVEVTVTDVANRLLQVGLDGAWGEIGMQPKTESEWAEVLKRAEKAFTDAARKK
jgi:hypothetical protein